jgi:non-ribosomal peptide synthetase component F
VFTALLYRYTGQRDLVVGCAAATRRGRAMRELVGYLVNPIVVRARFSEDSTFADAARSAHNSVANGMRHARYPFPVLVRDLDVPPKANRTPLFQITFTMIEASPLAPLSRLIPAAEEQGAEIEYAGLRLAQLDIRQMEGQFDLSVELRQVTGTLTAVFRYNTDLFDAVTIERFGRHYARLVDIASDDPESRIADASLLTAEELKNLLSFGACAPDIARV